MEANKLLDLAIPFVGAADIHQYMTITASNSATFFSFKIPYNYIGFMSHLYCVWYANTYIEFYIDNIFIEKIERVIGEVYAPFEYKPPFLVKKEIKLIGYNNDSASHTFEAVIDGLAFPEALARRRMATLLETK